LTSNTDHGRNRQLLIGDATVNTATKKTYVKPTLTKQQTLAAITAVTSSKPVT